MSVLGGTFPAVTVLLSLALLGERLAPRQAVGAVAVIVAARSWPPSLS